MQGEKNSTHRKRMFGHHYWPLANTRPPGKRRKRAAMVFWVLCVMAMTQFSCVRGEEIVVVAEEIGKSYSSLLVWSFLSLFLPSTIV